jgi:hypothetical protein
VSARPKASNPPYPPEYPRAIDLRRLGRRTLLALSAAALGAASAALLQGCATQGEPPVHALSDAGGHGDASAPSDAGGHPDADGGQP